VGRRVALLVLAVAVPAGVAADGGSGGLAELAAAGRWARILETVRSLVRQAPLDPGTALVAAEAARHTGAPEEERIAYLEAASADRATSQVATVELAEALAASRPPEALQLAMAVLLRPETPAIRRAAVDVAVRTIGAGARPEVRGFRRLLRLQPRSLRRRLKLAVALAPPVDRKALLTLLEERSNDLVAYRAARALQEAFPDGLPPQEVWAVARALYGHGLWGEAGRLLETVDRAGAGRPRWRVAFLRGRCAFRQERWEEAVRLYRRALRQATRRTDRADITVHMARTLELGGRPREAMAAAHRAVRERRSDDRLLLVARLALATGDPVSARHAIGRCRRRAARDRGSVLLALDALRRGAVDEAVTLLDGVRRRPWAGPAHVLGAILEAERRRVAEAVRLLDAAAVTGLDPFWEGSARRTMAGLPPEAVSAWRERSGPTAEGGLDRLVRWAALEPDETLLDATRRTLSSPPDHAPPLHGLAAALWGLGLHEAAARWDPAGFPSASFAEAAWSAAALSVLGFPGEGMAKADEARRRLHPRTPLALLPRPVARALFPLPEPLACRREAAAAGVPWALLAAIVREESRWRPDALSAVGARGLVQLMPETAARLAEDLGEPAPAPDELFDPDRALHLGAAELARLSAGLGEDTATVAAAYNAGEAQTRLWLAACPGPCTPERFVLTVTFGATRRYAARVAAGEEWYRRLYGAAASPGSARHGL